MNRIFCILYFVAWHSCRHRYQWVIDFNFFSSLPPMIRRKCGHARALMQQILGLIWSKFLQVYQTVSTCQWILKFFVASFLVTINLYDRCPMSVRRSVSFGLIKYVLKFEEKIGFLMWLWVMTEAKHNGSLWSYNYKILIFIII